MVFSSILFLLYFLPLFLLCYYASPRKFRNFVILIFSLAFYSWGAPKFIFVLLLLTGIDFLLVRRMYEEGQPAKRKLLLFISLSINLGLLFYFKYSNFFVDSVNQVLSAAGMTQISWTRILLPIGISFFIFETLTYSIDAYRKVITPLKKVTDYYLYILLFPKLIAGPIVRFNLIEDQILDRKETADDRLTGFYRFCIGLGKKVLIANVMGREADWIFNSDFSSFDSTMAWLGILAYTFQIYFDFSGYSDMALGLGKMMGFRLPENFDNPYIARSITEFWRRWHITLSMWMREYLYIPLGGNRVSGKARLYFNLWIVFLLSGLWHGASWNYVLWGAYHGLFLILDRMFLAALLDRCGKLVSTLFTFFLVMMGWVMFRLEELHLIPEFYKKLFSGPFRPYPFENHEEFYTIMLLAVFFSFFAYTSKGRWIQDKIFFQQYTNRRSLLMFFVCGILFILSVASITSSGFNPFIYYRF
jgi:alginate O-acetyltransferase complex protein AlgI